MVQVYSISVHSCIHPYRPFPIFAHPLHIFTTVLHPLKPGGVARLRPEVFQGVGD